MPFDKLKHIKMTIKKPPGIILFVLTVPVFVLLFSSQGFSQIQDVLPSRNIDVQVQSLPTATSGADNLTQSWSILDKLQEKDDELAKIPLSIGSKEINYYENRVYVLPYETEAECLKRKGDWQEDKNLCRSITRKKLSEKEMTFGLKTLNTQTGEVGVLKVSTKINAAGVSVVTPEGYKIEIVERPNGIKWNLWNTQYRVIAPDNLVVIKNNFPRKEKATVSRVVRGKTVKQTKELIKGFPYVPVSEYFETDDVRNVLVEAGRKHDKTVVAKAFETLKERGIDIDPEVLKPKFFERLPLLEQGDFTEFQVDPRKTAEKVLIILGANGGSAWKHTCNRSDACGWVQFTPRTYRNIRKTYPAAKLDSDFKTGAGNQLDSIMAAILLHKYNLRGLVDKYSEKVLSDPNLEEYLAAAYNGAPKWVHNSLTAAISKSLSDWVSALSSTRRDARGGLRKETREFMEKLRYLVANDLP